MKVERRAAPMEITVRHAESLWGQVRPKIQTRPGAPSSSQTESNLMDSLQKQSDVAPRHAWPLLNHSSSHSSSDSKARQPNTRLHAPCNPHPPYVDGLAVIVLEGAPEAARLKPGLHAAGQVRKHGLRWGVVTSQQLEVHFEPRQCQSKSNLTCRECALVFYSRHWHLDQKRVVQPSPPASGGTRCPPARPPPPGARSGSAACGRTVGAQTWLYANVL